MRVIAGLYRRRLLESLPGDQTRPMLDSMRETLFNILQTQIEGAVFADLYAGTGAVGIEALSRGARQAIFVEANPKALKVIERNLDKLGARAQARPMLGRSHEKVPHIEADIWFLGPPYAAHEEYEKTLAALGEKDVKLVITQHDKRYDPPLKPGKLERYRVVKMGSNALSFYRPAEQEKPAAEEPAAEADE
ncbi:MAG: 16S rRNA (guanine(966)-N(2))-methyltransferase RsmD [Acidobacteria bacterium]|nr:16S rRNA (guanine(966)-N(2))-methyltransferase RsmD [Acidobacteriota bacterium]